MADDGAELRDRHLNSTEPHSDKPFSISGQGHKEGLWFFSWRCSCCNLEASSLTIVDIGIIYSKQENGAHLFV